MVVPVTVTETLAIGEPAARSGTMPVIRPPAPCPRAVPFATASAGVSARQVIARFQFIRGSPPRGGPSATIICSYNEQKQYNHAHRRLQSDESGARRFC